MVYEELQVLSPLVPTRKFYFLRFCEQIEQHTWAIVDVSYNFPQEPFSNSQGPVRLLPSVAFFSNHNPVKEIGHIACGSHPGNRISVLGASGTSQSNMLILQESCIHSSGALVVYCPLDPHAINIAMSSEDPSVVPILSSGFAISPDAGENLGPGEMSAGSHVTIVVQIIVSNLTTGTMSQEAVNTINHLVGNTIRQIKAALNCSTC
ncbi:homeobox-leucine zipper protein HDG11-like [Apium graveolens]|uniref:homeobox-leucine zipper protein HDG11-like n=1 Tax=Apium graveolens TaxID=4045 RepID=UPI003D7C0482